MKNTIFYIAVLFVICLAGACTKIIDLKLGNDTGKLVIEGNITNVAGPQYILLSDNVPFTNTNTYPPVSGATVSVTDNNGNNYPFIESPAGTYSTSTLTGIPGNTYTMHVSTNGSAYTAVSTMPAVVTLDSISDQNAIFGGKNNKKEITIHYQDPAGIANQYRFVMYVNNVQVNHIFAYDDQFIDGRYVNLVLNENDIDIYAGDTVTVEMQCIDKNVYTYWSTLMQQSQNGPGGGVTPSNPPTNITPVSLGYFSAHTTDSKTIIVQ